MSVVEFCLALRKVRDPLAHDKDMEAHSPATSEKDAHGPTMKQKVAFILKSRRTLSLGTKACVDSEESLISSRRDWFGAYAGDRPPALMFPSARKKPTVYESPLHSPCQNPGRQSL